VAVKHDGPNPKWPQEVRGFWREITQKWTLNEEGRILLRIACEARTRMLDADKLLTRDGLVITTARGATRAHPAVGVRKEAEGTFLRCVRDLGLES
jgi:P27 family predicted phage terminase small subunit